MAVFDVEGSGSSHFVTKDGERCMGPFTSHGRALDVRDELIREARKRKRNCLTCTDEFMSEGPHNRMCDTCRAEASDAGMVA